MKRKKNRSSRHLQNNENRQSGNRWQNVRQLMRIGRQVPRQPLYLGLVAMILAAALDGVGIGLMIPFLNLLLSDGNSFHLPMIPFLQGAGLWLTQQPKGVLLACFSVLLFSLVGLKSVFSYIADDCSATYNQSIITLFRNRLFEKYLHAPIAFFDNEKLGSLLNMFGEVNNISILLGWAIGLVISLTILTAYIVTMMWVSWQLTLLIVLLIGGVSIGLNQLLSKIKPLGYAEYLAREAMQSRCLDTLAGVRIVQSYATQGFELKRFSQLTDAVKKSIILSGKKSRRIDPLTELATMGVAFLILVCSYNFL
ncbi:MAG: ABC transporter transmembrane domain-containing protein, partial [Kovacikia sp.]